MAIKKEGIPLFGGFFCHLWFAGFMRLAPVGENEAALRAVVYISTLVFFGLVLICFRFVRIEKLAPLADWVFAGAAILGMVLLSLPQPSFGIQAVATCLGGIGYGWTLLRWCLAFSKYGMREAIVYLLASLPALILLCALIQGLPRLGVVLVVVVCIALSTLFAKSANRKEAFSPVVSRQVFGKKPLPLGKLTVGIGFFTFSLGFIGAAFSVYRGESGAYAFTPYSLIAVAAVAFYEALSQREFTFGLRASIVSLAVSFFALLCLQIPVFQTMSAVLIASVQVFSKGILCIMLADIASRSRWHPFRVFAVGWPLLVTMPVVGSFFYELLSQMNLGNATVIVATLLIGLSVVLLMQIGMTAQNTEAGPAGKEREQSAEQGMDDACRSFAAEKELSSREAEVLCLYVRGRSKPYIAEALFVSENTVKAHIKRIYGKTGVHSKQELLDAVYGSMQNRSQPLP